MSYKLNSEEMSWFHGFASHKATSYPEPWKSAPDNIFGSDRILKAHHGISLSEDDRARVGSTLPWVLCGLFSWTPKRPSLGIDRDGLLVAYPTEYTAEGVVSKLLIMRDKKDSVSHTVHAVELSRDSESLSWETTSVPYPGTEDTRNTLYLLWLYRLVYEELLEETLHLGVSKEEDSIKSFIAYLTRVMNTAAAYDSLLSNWANDVVLLAKNLYNKSKADDNVLPDMAEARRTGEYPKLMLMPDSFSRAKSLIEELPGYVPAGCEWSFPSGVFATSTDADAEGAVVTIIASAPAKKRAKRKEAEQSQYDIAALREQFRLPLTSGRVYTAAEKAAIPRMDEGYVISEGNYRLAQEIYEAYPFIESLGLAANVMLVGDAGSGKTQTSRFLADVFDRPRTKETLRADTDESTLLGGYYPCFKDLNDWTGLDETDRKIIEQLEQQVLVSEKAAPSGTDQVLSAICAALEDDDMRAEVRSAYGVPSLEECLMDPESAWKALGHDSECPGFEAVASEANAKADKLQYRLLNILYSKQNEDKVTYRFLESQLLKAFEHGWLLEIQEAATVKNPGVLSILNSLLEPNGTIELPGRVVKRHPDTIVVITTNVGYEGCRKLNEALKDRMLCCDLMNTPSAEVMCQRILARLQFAAKRAGKELALSESDALAAAKVVWEVAQAAKKLDILGVYGMRSLLFWGLQLCMGHYSKDTFLRDVVQKMTVDEEDIAVLEEPFLNSIFSAKREERRRSDTAVELLYEGASA